MDAGLRLIAKVQVWTNELSRSERGATAIEYALVAGGIALAVATTVYAIGPSLVVLFETIANAEIWNV